MSIIWLASYPKSGNTWMRVFLTNYLRDADAPANVNDLEFTRLASSRELFARFAGIEASDLTPDEIDSIRPDVYEQVARTHDAPFFLKVHDAYTHLPDGRPLFPESATHGAIYIIRNPLDVAVSACAHLDLSSMDLAVQGMGVSYTMCHSIRGIFDQFRQRLGTWSHHVESWVDSPKRFPVHVVRYEDMLLDPQSTFAGIVRFAGLPVEQPRLEKALNFSRFETLQTQEAEHGFRERASRANPFFRRGKIGGWVRRLSERQVQRIVADQGSVMRCFGYLTEDDQIVYGEQAAECSASASCFGTARNWSSSV